jgi:hypothetical protein
MSVRTELEELVKWISDLSAEEEPDPTPEPLPREAWQAVDGDLRRASRKFAEAHDALLMKDPPSFLAEFACDLGREAEGLALRAHLLSRRAPRKPKSEPPPPTTLPPATEAAATGENARGEQHGTEKDEDRPAAKKSAADLVKSAGDTVETAHNKLEKVEHPDAVSKAFEEELDVLAEMTLSLRQQCERLDDGRKAAQVRR